MEMLGTVTRWGQGLVRWAGRDRDSLRQGLTLVLAGGQIVTTAVVVATGADRITSGDQSATTRLVPAGYTFGIWSVIYAGTLAYGIYQALPGQRREALLRRIGLPTAGVFLGTSVWLVAAQRDWIWVTVVVFFTMLLLLLGVMEEFVRQGAPRSAAERFLVVLPLSIYAGWASVATFANLSVALKATGRPPLGGDEVGEAVALLVTAGLVALAVTLRHRGNLGYALTVVWALVGIVAANAGRTPGATVALVAGGEAVLVALCSLRQPARPAHR
jgi:hypothetical protein